jgi:hypothetical protein
VDERPNISRLKNIGTARAHRLIPESRIIGFLDILQGRRRSLLDLVELLVEDTDNLDWPPEVQLSRLWPHLLGPRRGIQAPRVHGVQPLGVSEPKMKARRGRRLSRLWRRRRRRQGIRADVNAL